ncbi:PREDICTED: cell wall / vacuolar inhibitor of fructosidase 2-like [Nelumbo nucifera]|uniref:Pectinesterase inhibitor domain-containing protein n=2 Tax=Nelumbo nucifera TaxID=4432 RepID=A0A822Z535_NELNU|nr:PREDICTED: cell wall / vacuolar inhibitor of fructosidase 2-like [Nelumbo nucifera]DAD39947.1 TPA_asm: hypothetical protein HUJ06_014270 [Nelumbo nucifera]
MGSLGFLFLVLLPLSFPQLFFQQSSVLLVRGDAKLIQRTCKSTKHYDLCLSSLRSNSSSLKVDTKGLATIIIGIGMANATDTYSYLSSQLLSNTNDTALKTVLKGCADKYSYANDALQGALQQLALDSYDYAYVQVSAAVDYPNVCHNAFKRYPGLTYPPELALREQALESVCDVASGIIDLLGR